MLKTVALIAVAAGAASAFVPNAPLALRSTRSAQASSISSAQMASVSVQGGPSKIPCENGDTVREVMINGNAELYYTLKGKVWNCNGNGQCGTCKVELISGSVTPRTAAESKLLAKDPASFRLACQTAVQKGDVTVRNKPDA